MRIQNACRASIAATVSLVTLAACSASSGGASGGSGGSLEKRDIVVDAFPAIDSVGLFIAEQRGLFKEQGLNVTIKLAATSQTAIDGQLKGQYDITSADYVTYVNNVLLDKAPLRIIAESSFLQPNVLTLLAKPGSKVQSVRQLKNKTVSVNAPNDIGTLLIDSLLLEHGLTPREVHYVNVPFPGVEPALTAPRSAISAAFAPEPFVSFDEAAGFQELADLDQGSTQDFPIQGYAVTAAWAQKYPDTLKAFTIALNQGQQIADTDRAAVEAAIEKYLGVPKETAAFISLPTFPLGVDPVRLQRVVSAMTRFGLLPQGTNFKVTGMIDTDSQPSA